VLEFLAGAVAATAVSSHDRFHFPLFAMCSFGRWLSVTPCSGSRCPESVGPPDSAIRSFGIELHIDSQCSLEVLGP